MHHKRIPLPPESAFSRTIFKLVRPHIPRERWPAESVRVLFEPAGDGLWLEARFEGLPASYAALAAQLVREARVDLVLQSPAAGEAAAVARTKRWRDACLFAFVPLLFAIPLMAALSDAAMRMALLLCGVDVLALLVLQGALTKRRVAMATARFVAHVPSPGLKIHLGARADPRDNDPMPEV
ncbi:MAG: hypothetical protein H7Y60_03695 [Rhodospirillaceae bacterium]|nr:hypothetical protein [Rhodospirillales bacterium]